MRISVGPTTRRRLAARISVDLEHVGVGGWVSQIGSSVPTVMTSNPRLVLRINQIGVAAIAVPAEWGGCSHRDEFANFHAAALGETGATLGEGDCRLEVRGLDDRVSAHCGR